MSNDPILPGDVEKVIERLRKDLAAFENDVEQAWDREERPDLWEHVIEVPIPNVQTILSALTTSTEENKRLRAERDLLKAESDAKSNALAAMQDRVDWAYKQKEAAEAGHRMQTRATLSFREDWLASQSQAKAMKAALEEKDAEIERLQTSYRAGIWEEAAAFCAAARDGIDFAGLTESTSRQEGGFDMADHLTASFKELAESARRRSTLSIKGGERNGR